MDILELSNIYKPCIKDEITREVRKNFELNVVENTAYQKVQDEA